MKTLKILAIMAVCVLFGSNAFAASKNHYDAWQPKKQSVSRYDHNSGHKNKTAKHKRKQYNKKEVVVVNKHHRHNNNSHANAAAIGTAAIVLGIGILASTM